MLVGSTILYLLPHSEFTVNGSQFRVRGRCCTRTSKLRNFPSIPLSSDFGEPSRAVIGRRPRPLRDPAAPRLPRPSRVPEETALPPTGSDRIPLSSDFGEPSRAVIGRRPRPLRDPAAPRLPRPSRVPEETALPPTGSSTG